MMNIDNSKITYTTSRKGIYKDLYKALDAEKSNQNKKNEAFTARVPKGIYKDIYSGIEKTQVIQNTGKAIKENIWHKYPLKLLVYSNDFGEAVRPVIGGAMAKLSWIPAIFYTLFAINKGEEKNKTKELVFQGLASFLLPFLLLKSSRKVMHKAIDKIPASFKKTIKERTAKLSVLHKFIERFKKRDSSGYRNLALSAAGIGTIGLGAKPIDNVVKKFLEPQFGHGLPELVNGQ